jgi:hypothetical protein
MHPQRDVRNWAKADDRARGGDTLRRGTSEGAENREFLIVFQSKYPLGTRAAFTRPARSSSRNVCDSGDKSSEPLRRRLMQQGQ